MDKSSCIDISIASTSLGHQISWDVHSNPHNSDHYPICIQIGTPATNESKLIGINVIDWVKFKKKINDQIQQEKPESYLELRNIIIKNIEASKKKVQKISNPKSPWWNEECERIHKKKRRFFKIAVKTMQQKAWIKYKLNMAKLKLAIKKAKNIFWTKLTSKASEDGSIFKILDNIKKKNIDLKSNNILKIEGNYIIDQAVQANHFGRHFASDNHSESLEYKYTKKNLILDKPFTSSELERAIKQGKNTSPGKDGISTKMIKCINPSNLIYILNILNQSWNNSYIPKDWKEALILPISKTNSNKAVINNYRPISLTSCLCKTMERMISFRIVQFLLYNNKLLNNCYGFFPKRNCNQALSAIHGEIQLARSNKQYCVLAAIDLSAAYDNVWHDGLLYKLHNLGLGNNCVKWISEFLKNRSFQVKWRGELSNYFNYKKGVPQGSSLSPILFLLYLADLEEIINNDILQVIYADDIFLIGKDEDPLRLYDKMQEAIDSLINWSIKWKQKINTNKSVIMNFSNKKVIKDFNFYIDGVPIKQVKEHKILGVIFAENLIWKGHLNFIRNKANRNLNALKIVSSRSWGGGTSDLLKIVNSTIRNILDYGCHIYSISSDTFRCSIEPIYNHALRVATGLPRPTSIVCLRAEAGVTSIRARQDMLAMKHALKEVSLGSMSANNKQFKSQMHMGNKNWKKNCVPLPLKFQSWLTDNKIDVSQICNWENPIPLNDTSNILIYTDKFPFQQKGILKHLIRIAFSESLHKLWPKHIKIGTDASKNSLFTTAGVVIPDFGIKYNAKINPINSIFTAEGIAIILACREFIHSPGDYVIFSDSLSVLEALKSVNRNSTIIILKLLSTIRNNIKPGSTLNLVWVPGHSGIDINEQADLCAKNVTTFNEVVQDISPEDLVHHLKTSIIEQELYKWESSQLKANFPFIHPFKRWPSIHCKNRSMEILISKLRTNTAPLNQFLYYCKRRDSPNCSLCYVPETTHHFFIQCRKYLRQRTVLAKDLHLNCVGDLSLRFVLDFSLPPLPILRIAALERFLVSSALASFCGSLVQG